MEELENNFKEWLISKHIEFTYRQDDGSVLVNDNLLRPYEGELKKLFPEIIFEWEIQPEHRSFDE